MGKRIAAALLWFYAISCAWALAAAFTGWTPLVGPVMAMAVAALIAGDPLHRIWTTRARSEGENKLVSASQS